MCQKVSAQRGEEVTWRRPPGYFCSFHSDVSHHAKHPEEGEARPVWPSLAQGDLQFSVSVLFQILLYFTLNIEQKKKKNTSSVKEKLLCDFLYLYFTSTEKCNACSWVCLCVCGCVNEWHSSCLTVLMHTWFCSTPTRPHSLPCLTPWTPHLTPLCSDSLTSSVKH